MSYRSETLAKRPLWECEDCDRLTFSDPLAGDDWGGVERAVGPDCPECEAGMTLVENPTATEVFEAVGQHFHRDTGYVRPGKDCRLHDPEERQAEWDDWNELH